jgi:hypothetical protein
VKVFGGLDALDLRLTDIFGDDLMRLVDIGNEYVSFHWPQTTE